MESYQFKVVSVAHSAAEAGFVAITLERMDGGQFDAVFSVEDAKRLLDDLALQVQVADKQPRGARAGRA